MKEKVKVQVIENKTTVYEATDGTEFSNMAECQMYEQSARCALMTRYRKLVMNTVTEVELFGTGSEEHSIDLVKISEEKDIDLIMQLMFLNRSYLKEETYKNIVDSMAEACQKALDTSDLLLVSTGYGDEDFYVMNTAGWYINNIKECCNCNKEEQ